MHIRQFAASIAAVTLALAVYGGAAAGTTEPPGTEPVGTDPAPTETTEPATVDTTSPAGTTETTGATVDTTAALGTAPTADLPALTVGSADFNESQLLAEIYGQALRLVGFDVSIEPAIGSARSTSEPSTTARSTSCPSTPARCSRSCSLRNRLTQPRSRSRWRRSARRYPTTSRC